MSGEARGERRSDGRGRRAVRRLRCMNRLIPFQGSYSHPASPDGAPGNAAAPVRRFRFHHGVPRSTGRERASRVSCQALNAPLERTSEGGHIPRFIKHVLHVKSASGDLQVIAPKHPISYDILPPFVTCRAILLVCASCVNHTTGDGSPSVGLTPAHVLPSRPNALSNTPQGCGVAVPQSSGTAWGAGNLMPSSRPCSGPMGIP